VLMIDLNLRRIFSIAVVVLWCALHSIAAPVILQDYEPPGNLDAPFNLPPDFSGTTVGVVAATDTITHIPTDGAAGTTASAEHFLEHATAESPTAAGWQWQVRVLPNSGGSNNAQNPLFAADGYVGYWLKVDPSVTATMQTAPVLEGSAGTSTASSGDLQTVIKDGQWHLYQWNMDDPAQFDNSFNNVYAGGLGDTTLEAQVSFDSIAVISPDGGNATFRIDQIGYDNAGPLPEPTSAVLAALGLAAAFVARRRVV
jgi:MYXO-CTERM domain-containing protein